MDKIKKIAIKVKEHIGRNKVAYACGTVAITAVVALQVERKAYEKFLTEKGIDLTEFYNPEYFKELQTQATTPN
jgi:hypothetical protein